MTILEQLETFRPQLTRRGIQVGLQQNWASGKKWALKTRRIVLAASARQYYIWNAVADSRRAFKLNEDIAIGSLLLMAMVSFSAVSILANALYTFMQAAMVLSAISGANLALLATAAFGVVVTICAWVFALLQNMLSVSLMEGLTHKRSRSLRRTFAKSLMLAGRVVSAWTMLALLAFLPSGGITLGALFLQHLTHIALVDAFPYLAAIIIIATVWVGTILATYTLAPYVALFDPELTWRQTFDSARQLVRGRGRLFIVSGYVGLALLFTLSYWVALSVQQLTHINSTLIFITLVPAILAFANATLTAFYRKRKISRR